MKIAPVLTDLIGNTPLLALDRYAPGAHILAKLCLLYTSRCV